MPNDPDRAWEYYGKHDPYFGVLTQDVYRRTRLDEPASQQFFQSGEDLVEQTIHTIRTHLDPEFTPQRALDFGCGVGRVLIPLARMCNSILGVDVSEAMLDEARSNCAAVGVTNATFVTSDDSLTQVSETFDFIHSTIVFQHIPRRRGERIFARLLEQLDDHGVGAVHFTYARTGPAIGFIDWMRRWIPFVNGLINVALLRLPFNYPLIQVNTYDLDTLFHLLHEADCHRVYTSPTIHIFADRVKTYGVMLYFQKRRAEGL